MTKYLVIAGHGPNRDNSFDPGATGFITKGEHRYFRDDFFPAMRKYMKKDSNIILFSQYNVFDRSNLATLAKQYGKDTVVVEMHYDATDSPLASGGHVIVHKDFQPDKYDLAIRDVIKKHIGVRYVYKGHPGISGRSDLRNCNIARNNNVNYRLIELGFGTNKQDADKMVKNVDAIAKDFVMALEGEVKTVEAPIKQVASAQTKKGVQLSGEAHVQSKGWIPMKNNILGTTGEKLRLEAFNIVAKHNDKLLSVKGVIHLQSKGDVRVDTNLFGTVGEKRRLEAIKLDIHKDVEYRVHMQYEGWSTWAKNNEWAGSKGKERRIEAIEFRVK